jgi:hypothetical protein
MRSGSRYNSPMLILRPHPWTYHPVPQQQRLCDCVDRTDAADFEEPRDRRPPGRTGGASTASLTGRLARWLGLG